MKSLTMVGLTLGWLFVAPAWATHLDVVKAHSTSATSLDVPDGADLRVYLTPQALGAFAIDTRCVQNTCLPDGKPGVWHVSGELPSAAVAKSAWDQALKTGTPKTLVLDSEGGNVGGAFFLMARAIEDHLDVEVPAGGSCVSACVYVLTGGEQRRVSAWALIGVHRQNQSKYFVPKTLDQASGKPRGGTPNDTALNAKLQAIDQVSTSAQMVDAYWGKAMALRQVSPLLLMYAASAEQSHVTSNLRVLTQACAKSLNLDNTRTANDAPSAGRALTVCGDVHFAF